jgi:hypothetical protein
MADDNNQGTPPATPPATPADAGGAAKPEALLNYKEVVELRKETRETRDLLKQLLESGRSSTAPTAPAATTKPETKPEAASGTNDGVAELRARLDASERNSALKDAFLEHGITDPDLRDLLKTAASQASPTDVGAIVAKYAAKLKPAVAPTQSTSEPAKQVVAPGTSNTGAAGGEARTQIPNDVLAVSKEAWAQLSPADKRARYEADKRAKGGDFNPFAESKRTSKK